MAHVDKLISRDGSRKYVFALSDALQMEAAFFRVPGRERPNIACISTQIGCAVGCPFCATAGAPFFRNLTKDEILLEISSVLADHDAEALLGEGFEVSFMGMGEPLANLRNLLAAVEELGRRYPQITRASVSTAGPARRIEALTAAMPTSPPVHLQISLHATSDSTRRRLIPNAPDSIDNLFRAGRRFHEKTGDRVYLNYVLLKGINDSEADAQWLAQLDQEAFCLKISALNSVPNLPAELEGASLEDILCFSHKLREHGLGHKVFVGDGLDVQASCGQMAATPRELVESGAFETRDR